MYVFVGEFLLQKVIHVNRIIRLDNKTTSTKTTSTETKNRGYLKNKA